MCNCKTCENPPCIDRNSLDQGTHVLFESCKGHKKTGHNQKDGEKASEEIDREVFNHLIGYTKQRIEYFKHNDSYEWSNTMVMLRQNLSNLFYELAEGDLTLEDVEEEMERAHSLAREQAENSEFNTNTSTEEAK